MKTYEQTLKHIKVNKHQYFVYDDPFRTHNNLTKILDTVSFIFEVDNIDVVNDFADVE